MHVFCTFYYFTLNTNSCIFAAQTNIFLHMKTRIITFIISLACISVQAKDKVHVSLGNLGHLNPSVIPAVSTDGDGVVIKCDSTLYNVDVVISDQYGNVMHQSTQTINPMESTIFVPDSGDGSEKTSIDLYYDDKHLKGYFE